MINDNPVRRQDDSTRETILTCALVLFSAKGYEAAGIQEICEAAGITKPTLYYYFGSKRGLLDAIIETHGNRLLEVLRRGASNPRDVKVTLEQLLRLTLEYARKYPEFYRLWVLARFAPPGCELASASTVLIAQVREILIEVFGEFARAHGNMARRQAQYAASFLGLMDVCIGQELGGGMESAPRKLTESALQKAVHQYMHGIFS